MEEITGNIAILRGNWNCRQIVEIDENYVNDVKRF